MQPRLTLLPRAALMLIIAFFLLTTLPVALMRPTGGRSGERQGQTAGMIRVFCEDPRPGDPRWSPLSGPQVMYGHNPFNLELPLFEWAQGRIARAIDGPECDSVEPVAKVASVLFSVLGIAGAFLLAGHLWGSAAGILAAALLASDGLWLRYSTYSMLDNRMLALAVFAMVFSVRRRHVAAFLLWSLTAAQKPQAFVFLAAFWATLEWVHARLEGKGPLAFLAERERRGTLIAFSAACGTGYAYYLWSSALNAESDLPWTLWMGPRSRQWFFGDWSERFHLVYYKSLFLDWLKRSGLNIAAAAGIGLSLVSPIFRAKLREERAWRTLLLLSLPLLAGRFLYTFVFYNVFVVHEYYSLPLNVGSALTTGAVLGTLWQTGRSLKPGPAHAAAAPRARFALLFALACAIGYRATLGARSYLSYALEINDPADWRYLTEWNQQVFPEKRSFVVMAGPVSGRDILFLYLSKQRGFSWCHSNEEFAPRAFWQSQGVRYVAWWKSYEPSTRRNRWVVRTMDEELALARERGWSSDASDAWAGRSMREWARIAGKNGRDPCGPASGHDPRKW